MKAVLKPVPPGAGTIRAQLDQFRECFRYISEGMLLVHKFFHSYFSVYPSDFLSEWLSNVGSRTFFDGKNSWKFAFMIFLEFFTIWLIKNA